jgi:hypothetical protein
MLTAFLCCELAKLITGDIVDRDLVTAFANAGSELGAGWVTIELDVVDLVPVNQMTTGSLIHAV